MVMSPVQQKISNFFARYPVSTFEKRQLLAHAGEDVPGVMFLVDGRVSQYDITPAGNQVVVNVFKAGSFFPMSWAINRTPNRYFFEAATRLHVRIAPAAAVLVFLHDNPDVTFDLLSRVYRGTDGVLRRMVHLMNGGAKSRVLFELLQAAARFGEPLPDGSVFIPLGESSLGKHSGLARETVNRSLRSLKQLGLVQVERQGITIRDIARLEQLLDDGYSR